MCLAGCRTWCPTNLQHLCCEALINKLNDPVSVTTPLLVYELCYLQSINPTLARAKCYHTMDAFVRLVVVLVRFSGESTNNVTKINLVNKVTVSGYI